MKPYGGRDPEREALASELRLRCTEAMILSLDRELRITYILGDVFGLSGEEAAEVLEIEPAAYRKRLSRARAHACTLFCASGAVFSIRRTPVAAPGKCRRWWHAGCWPRAIFT